jgi:two-component system, response regulator YesN
MYKLLIVDDEHIVREGLKIIIDWNDYGFQVCGEAVDGKDGLNKILELDPDLVLMDIKMPGLQGIDVIEEVRKRGFSGKIILLTGYSEFEYAQSAIKLGVSYYLLKPIDEDELIEAAAKIYKELQEEARIKNYIDKSKKYIQNDTIRKIVTQEESIDNLRKEIETSNFNFNFNSYQVAILDVNMRKNNSDNVIEQYCHRILEHIKDVELFIDEDKPALVLKGRNVEDAVDVLNMLYKNIVEENSEYRVFIALGRTVNDIKDTYVSHRDARTIMNKRFLYGNLRVAALEQINITDGMQNQNIKEVDLDKIYTAVEVGDSEKLDHAFDEMDVFFKQSGFSAEKIKGMCVNYFIEMKDKVVLNYEEYKESMPSKEVVIHKIYEKGNLFDLLEYLKGEFINISRTISNTNSENTMKRILNYIHKNYNKELRLELLAEIFNYNSAYLGKMFKNYTGESFNVYLDKVRIDNAKAMLLNNDLKVYQVSEKVGISNIDYFYSKFKKYVGISPKEFRNSKE